MKVEEAIEQLLEMPMDVDLVICAHGFTGMEGKGWHVSHFETNEAKSVVLIEGATQPPPHAPGEGDLIHEGWAGQPER